MINSIRYFTLNNTNILKDLNKTCKHPLFIKHDMQHGWQNLPVSWKGKYHTLFYSTPWMTPLSRSTGTWRWVPEEWCPGCGSSLTYRIPRAACMILPCRGSDPQRKQFCETQKIFSFSSWKKQTSKAERNCTQWKKPKNKQKTTNKTHHKMTLQFTHNILELCKF